MNVNNLFSKKRNWTSALVQVAVMAGSFSASAAANAYYARRRGSYSAGKNQSYLVHNGLGNTSGNLLWHKQNRISLKSISSVCDVTINKAGWQELLIIDRNIKDYRTISKLARPGIDVVEIPQEANGLDFILNKLSDYKNLNTVHVFAHAAAGKLLFGNTLVDSRALKESSEFTQAIDRAVKPGGEILLHGYDLAKGVPGNEPLQIFRNKAYAAQGLSTTYTVTSSSDSGVDATFGADAAADQADGSGLSLREALHWAQDGDEVTFNAGMTIALTSGELTIVHGINIDGDLDNNNTADVTIDAGYHSRVIKVTSGTVTLDGLIIQHGLLSGAGANKGQSGGSSLGAGISNAGTLTLKNVTVTHNYATGGGGAVPAGAYGGGGGGGGGGVQSIGGAPGGYTIASSTYSGQAGGSGRGGNGGSYNGIKMNGRGGTSGTAGPGVGGGAGGYGASYRDGGAGGTATVGGISIGGGGGGSGWNGTGGMGGNAAGGIYNSGKLFVLGSSAITNNAAAGGGGGGGQTGGIGGTAGGGIWNDYVGRVYVTSAAYSAMTGNSAGSGFGGFNSSHIQAASGFANATIYNNGGTLDTNYSTVALTSATYDANTGVLTVTGIDMTAGDTIDPTKLTITGEGGRTYTLTGSTVTASSSTSFSITLNATDKDAVNQMLNKNGTSSTGNTTYNLAGAANWDSTASSRADATGNGITVSNVAAPTITSATYNASTGALTVSGTGFLSLSGATNDIVANKFTFTGEGGATYTLTNTGNGEITSGTSFTLTLSATDRAGVNALINKNGTSSISGTTYNLAAAEDWAAGADAAVVTADTTGNGITASNVAIPPVVATDSGSAAFVAGNNTTSIPVAVDAGITVTDADNSTEVSATVAITGNFHSGEDVLAFTNTSGTLFGNISASYNAATGILTLTSAGATATLAQWQSALQSTTYTSTAVTPNTSTRTISFTVNDGTNNSNTGTRTVTVTATDQTPIVTTDSGSASFVAGNNTTSIPVVVDAGITVTDADNSTEVSATVAITGNFHSGEDVLAFTNTSGTLFGNISASYNATTGVLTLTSAGATATLAQWQSALQSTTYTSTAVTPNTSTRTISFTVNDGTNNSNTGTRTVTVTATDQTPIVTTDSGSAAFVAGNNTTSIPVVVDAGITVTDADNSTEVSATVAITGNFHSGEDVLAFTNTSGTLFGNISASYNATTGVLTLTSAGATATLAQWQSALQSTTYTSTAVTPNTSTRTISFTVNDGTSNSNTGTRTVTVTATDQTPIVTTTGGTKNYITGASAITIDGSVTVTDGDNTVQGSGTVSISGGFHSGDVLSFTNDGSTMGNITAVYTAGTGVLALTSAGNTATLAQWSKAMSAVKFSSTSTTAGNRTISFTTSDGTKTSAAATDVVAVASPPAITSATYDASTGTLTVTGTGFLSLSGATNDIVANKFTFTGEGGSTYTLTDTGNGEITSSTSFTLTLSANDKAGVASIINKNGTSSTGGTTYNLAAAEDWAAGADAAVVVADNTGNGITVSNVAVPAITSATYDVSTGALTVTGTGFLSLSGATNDIVANKFTFTGEGGATYTLTDSANPEITSGTSFTITLSATDKAGVNFLVNKNGTSSTGGTTYNLAAAEDWAAGADAAVVVADNTGNGITVSNVAVPAITSATYDVSTGALTVTGTGFLSLSGATNDIVANKFTFTGEGGATYTLTDSANPEITSRTSFTITLSATDKAGVNFLVNKNGTSSTGGTTYNLAAAEDWAAGADAAIVVADNTGNGITVSNVAVPAITSATYDVSTGALTVTGTGFLSLSGATNDIVANKFTFTGEGGSTYTLTDSANPEITGGTSFTINLSATDKAGVNALLNKNGTSSTGGTTYNLAAAEDWAAGADAAVAVADNTGNGITVSNVAPKISSIVRTGAASNIVPSSATSVSYTVTFSEAVTGVDVTDFSLTATGTADGSIASLSGSGTTYTVTVNTLSGDGILRLDLNSSGTGIQNGSSIVIVSGYTSGQTYTFDHTAPSAPTALAVDPASDSGTSSSDGITNVTTPVIKGIAEANSTVKLYDTDGTTLLGSATVDGSGNWSITSSTLSSGSHTLTAKATDGAGNVSSASSGLSITIDTTAPTLAITSDKSALKSGETATITFTFSEDPGATFAWDGTSGDVTVSGGTLAAISGSGLTRTATFTPTASTNSGTTSITVATSSYTDAAGNNGDAGTTPSLTFDTLIPNAPSTPDMTMASDAGTSVTDDLTKTTAPTFIGTAEANSTVKLYDTDGTTLLGSATADGSGNWSITSSTLSSGSHTLTAKATDGAGNVSSASSGLSITIDTTAPTLAITSDKSALKSGETATITFTFSEDPGATFTWDGSSGDVTVSGGTLAAISGTGLTRTAVFTPNTNTNGGTASITVSAGTYTDAAGNAGGAGTTPLLNFDTQAPTLAITSDKSALKSGETAAITFTFSEDPGATFTWDGSSGDVTISGGTLSAISGTGLTRTAVFTPNTNTNGGTASVTVSAGTYTDAAGNAGGAGTTPLLNFDTQAPTLAITSDKSALKSGETATITFTFSEDPGATFTWDGSSGDVTVSGGTLSAISGTGLTRTAVFTPNTNTNGGTVSITVSAGTYTDAAGNAGGAGTTPLLNFDTQAPTLAITSDKSTLKSGETATITFTFSEDPGATFTWDGSSGDVTVSGGTLAAISGTGLTRTATFTPTAATNSGTASVTVSAGSYTDAAGNVGGAGTTPLLNFDTQAPTLAITSDKSALKSGETAAITFTFSEDPGATFTWDGSSGDVTVSGGTLAAISGTGLTRTATFTPTAATNSGTASITVSAGTYTDAAGNAGGAGTTPLLNFDTQVPTLAITSDKSALKSGETATITFTFSEDPGATFTWDGSSGDVTVSGGTLSAISGTGLTRTAVFTPNTNTNGGTVSITVSAGTYTDAAGNAGGAGTTPSLNFDTQAPTLTTAVIASNNINASKAKVGDVATILFTSSEAVATPTVTIGGHSASVSNISGNDWMATYTLTGTDTEGTLPFSVSFADIAGNPGTNVTATTNSSAVVFDKTAPSTPTELAATHGDQQIILNWSTNNEADLQSYKIYQGTSVNPTTLLTTISAGTTTYTNTGLTNGVTYYYRISAVDNTGNESTLSTDVSDAAKGTQTITFNALAGATYGDLPVTLTATASSALTVAYTSSNTAVATVSGNTVTIIGAGTTNITASQAGNGTYEAAPDVSQTLTVNARSVTVTADAKSKTYGDLDPALTYQLTSGALVGTDDFTGSLTRDAGEDVGSYAIKQGTLTLGNNYTLTYNGTNLIIGKKTVAVTADSQTKTYGDTDPVLTYQITSGALVGTDTFTGAPTRDAGEDVGSYAIKQGTLALNNNYTLTYTGANLNIGHKAVTVTANAQSKTYGDADPALSYQITSGSLIGTDAFTGSLTRDAGEDVGSYAIKQGTLALNNNYTLTYTGANLNIGHKAVTVTANAQSKTYGDADPALSYQITSGSLIGTDAFTGSLTRDIGEDVGNYAIKQNTLALNNNYTLTYAGAQLAIGKKAITVTAAAKSKVYGAADPALTYTYAPNLSSGDSFSGSLSRDAGEDVGNYAIKQGTLTLSNNYTLNYTGANLTISNATLTITVQNQSKVYGSANPDLTISYSGFVNGDTEANLTSKAVASTGATAASAVGTYAITAGGATMPGYKIIYVPGMLTVNKAILNITAEDKSRDYGQSNPQFTVTYNGFVNGDTPAGLTAQPSASTNATATSAPGKYPIIAEGAMSPNYTFTYSSGILTVVPLTNAVMADLKISSGSLSPAFNGSVYQYADSVSHTTSQVILTPTADPTAIVSINGNTTVNNAASAPIALNPGDNNITLIVTAQDGTTKRTYTVVVHRALPPALIVPTNVLSPNGDGKNDAWIVKDIELYPNSKVSIYDRAGREVYSKRGYSNDWNGTLRGAPLAQGTYYYVIDLGAGTALMKGFITILKAY